MVFVLLGVTAIGVVVTMVGTLVGIGWRWRTVRSIDE